MIIYYTIGIGKSVLTMSMLLLSSVLNPDSNLEDSCIRLGVLVVVHGYATYVMGTGIMWAHLVRPRLAAISMATPLFKFDLHTGTKQWWNLHAYMYHHQQREQTGYNRAQCHSPYMAILQCESWYHERIPSLTRLDVRSIERVGTRPESRGHAQMRWRLV